MSSSTSSTPSKQRYFDVTIQGHRWVAVIRKVEGDSPDAVLEKMDSFNSDYSKVTIIKEIAV